MNQTELVNRIVNEKSRKRHLKKFDLVFLEKDFEVIDKLRDEAMREGLTPGAYIIQAVREKMGMADIKVKSFRRKFVEDLRKREPSVKRLGDADVDDVDEWLASRTVVVQEKPVEKINLPLPTLGEVRIPAAKNKLQDDGIDDIPVNHTEFGPMPEGMPGSYAKEVT